VTLHCVRAGDNLGKEARMPNLESGAVSKVSRVSFSCLADSSCFFNRSRSRIRWGRYRRFSDERLLMR
jgi:hypothetical protein